MRKQYYMEVENVNEKKLFPEKKLLKKSISEFIEKKGFYIVLILCVAIIGATAVFLSTTKGSTQNSDYNAKIIPEAEANPSTIVDKSQPAQPGKNTADIAGPSKAVANVPVVKDPSIVPKDTPKQPDKPTKSTTTPAKSKVKSASVKELQKFIRPVFGEISFDYSEDKLVYSKTLEEWRTHRGTDITAERGAQVKAVADGVISEIKTDPLFGITILIDHQNGLKTLYSNLASDEMVAPNQKVKRGDVIGAVGSTSTIEAAEQSHLHFEVWKQNKVVNPDKYLPVK